MFSSLSHVLLELLLSGCSPRKAVLCFLFPWFSLLSFCLFCSDVFLTSWNYQHSLNCSPPGSSLFSMTPLHMEFFTHCSKQIQSFEAEPFILMAFLPEQNACATAPELGMRPLFSKYHLILGHSRQEVAIPGLLICPSHAESSPYK